MKALSRHISITATVWLTLGLCLPEAGPALAATVCSKTTENPGGKPGAYPTFCSIPAVPKGVRDATAFKAAVVDTRLAGRDLVRDTQTERFTLDQTTAFAAQAKLEATPPPPVTTPDQGDTTSFVKDARAKAKPPRPR